MRVVTATNSLEPFLRGRWLKPGAHVNAVGSPRPTWRELYDETMNNILIVDSREAGAERVRRRNSFQRPHFRGSGRVVRGKEIGASLGHDRLQVRWHRNRRYSHGQTRVGGGNLVVTR